MSSVHFSTGDFLKRKVRINLKAKQKVYAYNCLRIHIQFMTGAIPERNFWIPGYFLVFWQSLFKILLSLEEIKLNNILWKNISIMETLTILIQRGFLSNFWKYKLFEHFSYSPNDFFKFVLSILQFEYFVDDKKIYFSLNAKILCFFRIFFFLKINLFFIWTSPRSLRAIRIFMS